MRQMFNKLLYGMIPILGIFYWAWSLARYALLSPPKDAARASSAAPPVCVYATHLSHKDASLVRPAMRSSPAGVGAGSAAPMRERLGEWSAAVPVNGVRRRQAEALLRHWEREAADSAPNASSRNMPVSRTIFVAGLALRRSTIDVVRTRRENGAEPRSGS